MNALRSAPLLGIMLGVFANGCTARLPTDVQRLQSITIGGEDYAGVVGLLPGRYSSQTAALRAACEKYLNLPGAFNPFDRSLDPKGWWDYWRRASTEYCGIVVTTGVDEYGNSKITTDEVQGQGGQKSCLFPDFVLVESSPKRAYSRKRALSHNHGGGTELSSGDCTALKRALAFEAGLASRISADLSLTVVAFIGRHGQDRVECAGWYEMTVRYSSVGYEGQQAVAKYFDANTGQYAAKVTYFDLGTCMVKQ